MNRNQPLAVDFHVAEKIFIFFCTYEHDTHSNSTKKLLTFLLTKPPINPTVSQITQIVCLFKSYLLASPN